MEPITKKTVKVVSGSSVALSIVSIIGTIGILYLLLTMLTVGAQRSIVAWFALMILGIATYYFAFSVLSWLYVRTKKPAVANVAKV
jgi:hypothetical protein